MGWNIVLLKEYLNFLELYFQQLNEEFSKVPAMVQQQQNPSQETGWLETLHPCKVRKLLNKSLRTAFDISRWKQLLYFAYVLMLSKPFCNLIDITVTLCNIISPDFVLNRLLATVSYLVFRHESDIDLFS